MSWRSTRAAGEGDQANRQVAVIDLGSNSWRLVVFTYTPGAWWKRTDELYETVPGMAATGRLSDEAIERGLETLDVFERFCSVAPKRIQRTPGLIRISPVRVTRASAAAGASDGSAQSTTYRRTSSGRP